MVVWEQAERNKAHQRRYQSKVALFFSLRAAAILDGFSRWGPSDQAQGFIDEGSQNWSDHLLSSPSHPNLRLSPLQNDSVFRWFLTLGFSPDSILPSAHVCEFPRPRQMPCRLAICLCFLLAASGGFFGTLKKAIFLQFSRLHFFSAT